MFWMACSSRFSRLWRTHPETPWLWDFHCAGHMEGGHRRMPLSRSGPSVTSPSSWGAKRCMKTDFPVCFHLQIYGNMVSTEGFRCLLMLPLPSRWRTPRLSTRLRARTVCFSHITSPVILVHKTGNSSQAVCERSALATSASDTAAVCCRIALSRLYCSTAVRVPRTAGSFQPGKVRGRLWLRGPGARRRPATAGGASACARRRAAPPRATCGTKTTW